MTIRYVARPKALYDDMEQHMQWVPPATLSVFEPDDNSRKTGLLDVRGNPIYAVSEIDRIGFIPPGDCK